MRIVGHGIDLQDVRRVEKLLESQHNDWLEGAFTEYEQNSADPQPNTAKYYAARFAAKEAVAKALGTGFTDDVAWLDIEIRRAESGAPEVHLTGGAKVVELALGIKGWLMSISHSGEYSMASVIATG